MKRLLLIPLLFLCSCAFDLKENTQIGVNNQENTYKVYELGYTTDDYGYVYLATINYLDNAKLQLYKYKDKDSVVVKEWEFGKYNVIYEQWNKDYLYDYGSFAIYRPHGLK